MWMVRICWLKQNRMMQNVQRKGHNIRTLWYGVDPVVFCFPRTTVLFRPEAHGLLRFLKMTWWSEVKQMLINNKTSKKTWYTTIKLFQASVLAPSKLFSSQTPSEVFPEDTIDVVYAEDEEVFRETAVRELLKVGFLRPPRFGLKNKKPMAKSGKKQNRWNGWKRKKEHLFLGRVEGVGDYWRS